MISHPTIAAVIIGRNEGQRLVRCLDSVRGSVGRIVYVDSGSTDGSVDVARGAGAEVVELDISKPFTAARARNAGIAALRRSAVPDWVQFIDGDCELQPGWIPTALAFLETSPTAAVACGRRRERHPETSVYNRLCDREWDTPIGLTRSCGGDALMRWTALEETGGFNPDLIAGEEPELCVRLRSKNWEIWRLDVEMTFHDAAMTRFSQWWNRMRRGGHAAAEGMALHGRLPERHGVATVRRAVFWSLFLPVTIIFGAILFGSPVLMMLLAYPAQMVRIAWRSGGRTEDWEAAFFLLLGKFAEMTGITEYLLRRRLGRPSALIEYK